MLQTSMTLRRRPLGIAFAALFAIAAASPALLVTADAAAQGDTGHPWLGVAMDSDASAPGVRVGHVVRGSPADKAGVREGDRILRIAGAAVSRGADVVRAVGAHAVGDAIAIELARGAQSRTVRVVLAAFPSQDDMMRMDLVGTFAPTWKGIDAVSGTFPPSIASLRGRVVLLDFWATWCGPCRVIVPKLHALQARYGAQGLSVLGVSTEDAEDVALFAQRMALSYPVGVDRRAETTRAYGVMSLPTLVIIDKRGVVRDVDVGYDPVETGRLDAAVRALLAEPAPAH
jgi:thiol-disulfide isomerase/thioredoxin